MAWSLAGRLARAQTPHSSTRCWMLPSRRSPPAATGPSCTRIAVATTVGLDGYPGSPMRSWFARCRERGARWTTRRARLLRPAEKRVVLRAQLAVHHRRGVHRCAGLLHPVVQRGTDQSLAALAAPSNTAGTSDLLPNQSNFLAAPLWVSFGLPLTASPAFPKRPLRSSARWRREINGLLTKVSGRSTLPLS